MNPPRLHWKSALAGATTLAVVLVTTGMIQVTSRGTGGAPYVLAEGVTAEHLAILNTMSLVDVPDGQGGTTPHLRISGVNLQIVNGLGATNGSPGDVDATDFLLTNTNGVGNLIVGYNELGNPNNDVRTGSHNVVIGHGNNYDSFGGIITARDNAIGAPYACITGGTGNRCSGEFSSVNGGRNNDATGHQSAVYGGSGNDAIGFQSTVLGGASSLASANQSTIAGGNQNIASGDQSTVSGGFRNEASGNGTSVSGGQNNIASGNRAWVGGGMNNLAAGNHSCVSGGRFNFAEGFWSSVGGGFLNVAGPAAANDVTVSGGQSRTTINSQDWAGGSLLEEN